tara:strand:- start:1 stop:252 length:252 start_codon:yes stop_codon:yes gene_type:complete
MADNTLSLWHLGDLVGTGENSPNGLLLLKAEGVQYQQDWAKISPFVGEMVISEDIKDPKAIEGFRVSEIWAWDGKKVWNRPRK